MTEESWLEWFWRRPIAGVEPLVVVAPVEHIRDIYSKVHERQMDMPTVSRKSAVRRLAKAKKKAAPKRKR